ncbi:MAG: helix-turn-helix domain-containing protein, partial [Hyphomonadaceae bacterium]
LTLEQVAGWTRVRKEYLEALEEMNAKLLPGKAYALAYLRSYENALGLQKSDIVEQFQREVALSREDDRPQVRDPASRPRRVRPWMPVLGLAAIAGGFIAFQLLKDEILPPDPVASAQAAAPGVRAPAPAVVDTGPVRTAAGVIEVRAIAEAHLEARGPDGTVYLYRTLQPGDVYRPDPGPGWTLHARDGGAFELSVDGAPAGRLGEAGAPVLGRRIDEIEPLTPGEARALAR